MLQRNLYIAPDPHTPSKFWKYWQVLYNTPFSRNLVVKTYFDGGLYLGEETVLFHFSTQ